MIGNDCPCGWEVDETEVRRFSAEWHRLHRDAHLAAFPDLDQSSRDNLTMFVDMAERVEFVRAHPETTTPDDLAAWR